MIRVLYPFGGFKRGELLDDDCLPADKLPALKRLHWVQEEAAPPDEDEMVAPKPRVRKVQREESS